ncbi:MAG: hypothetical protein K6G45_09285 [Lachnospiraceae bacterium]|nr:hypothetical protein [Lachnospiraceae bacterium]
MQELHIPGWFYYVLDDLAPKFNPNKVGKWMYFYKGTDGFEFTKKMCKLAIESKITFEAKISDNPFQGVSCFYTEIDDLKTHKKIISFFLEHNMIRKTKTGKLYDISFKLDSQTTAGQYSSNFNSELKLSEFINLNTAEWIK